MATTNTIGAVFTLQNNGFTQAITQNIQSARQMQQTLNSTIKSTQNLNQNNGILGNSFQSLAKKVTGIAAGFGLSFGFVKLAKDSIELASNLNEVQNVVDVTFDKGSKQIDDWSNKALSAFGLSKLQAEKFNGTMGAMLKSSGVTGDAMVNMSEKLSGLSGDLASFYNLSQQDAFDKIKSGISGETEPLKQLGINMSVANLQAFALSQGIKTSYNDMDQASQTMLRYNYLMSVSKDSQGDFARTQGGFANQVRIAKTNLQQLGATLGSQVLPFLDGILIKFNSGISNISKFGSTINNLKPIFDDVKSSLQTLVSKYMALAESQIKLIIKAVTDLYTDAKPALTWIIENGLKVVTSTLGTLYDTQKKLFNFINNNWSLIKPLVEGIVIAWGTYKTITLTVTTVTKGMALAQAALNLVMNANPIGIVVTAIGLLIGVGIALYQNWDTVKKKAQELWDGIKSIFSGITSWFDKNVIQPIQSIMPSWLRNLFSGGVNAKVTVTSNTSGATSVNGSHASGLNYVPFDGYIAELHKGERVQTASQNPYNGGADKGSSNKSVNVTIQNINVSGGTDKAEATALEIKKQLQLALANI